MPETCLIPTQDEIQNSMLYQFMQYVKDHGFEGETYDELHHWSVQDPVQFWPAVASFCQIELDRPAQHIYLETPNPPYAVGLVPDKMDLDRIMRLLRPKRVRSIANATSSIQ